MRNFSEVANRLKDAQACHESAQKYFPSADYRVVAQNAQLCVELSAKAVIAYFAEPVWSHDPSQQLLRILREHGQEIVEEFGEEMLESLHQLALDAEEAAPWHAWSTYGREDEEGKWKPAIDVCTEGIASDLLAMAERSFKTASKLLGKFAQAANLPAAG